jgi:CelD/BcsL family acetyltransferase involved in cellulose biosynthesis
MQLYEIDPVRESRWTDLVRRCDLSSIFHTAGWLEALRRTYDYQPVAFTDAGPGEPLRNGLLFCRVRSWMTGRRLVSLPFSDHCEPLIESRETLQEMASLLKARTSDEGQYIELRPLASTLEADGFSMAARYHHHLIDLRPDVRTLFAGFHKNHIQRTIRRALRFGVTTEIGRSSALLKEFYTLHAATRRRHGLPVQPVNWFRNLVDCLGEDLDILLARYQDCPIAAMVTATHKKTIVYKYGCSDAAKHRYGGPSLLFWVAIQRAKEQGLAEFDLGRSDWDDKGLLAYKNHLGAQRATLSYFRCALGSTRARNFSGWSSGLRMAYSLAPSTLRTRVGSGLYRHFG